MKLLFDQNLSPRLAQRLRGLYPGSLHVREAGLESADDVVVWGYAREHGFTLVSKDSDFRQMSFVYGHPPKVIWIRRGNCSTAEAEAILIGRIEALAAFHDDPDGAFLALA